MIIDLSGAISCEWFSADGKKQRFTEKSALSAIKSIIGEDLLREIMEDFGRPNLYTYIHQVPKRRGETEDQKVERVFVYEAILSLTRYREKQRDNVDIRVVK